MSTIFTDGTIVARKTHHTKVARAIYPEIGIDDTAILASKHRRCAYRVVNGAAELLHVLGEAFPAAVDERLGRDERALDLQAERRRLQELERVVEDVHAEVKVRLVREVVRIDRGRGERIAGRDVHAAAGKRVR